MNNEYLEINSYRSYLIRWCRKHKEQIKDSAKKRKLNIDFDLEDINSLLEWPNFIDSEVTDQYKIIFETSSHGDTISEITDEEWNKIVLENTLDLNINISKNPIIKSKCFFIKTALKSFLTEYLSYQQYDIFEVPSLIQKEGLINSGHLPSWEKELFKVNENHYLIPTSECYLANIPYTDFTKPLYLSAYSGNFRVEAGSRGKRDKGIKRKKQFDKFEIFATCHIDQYRKCFKKMYGDIFYLLEKFNLKFKVVCLPSWDMSKNAVLTYDFEVWLPKSKEWIEISSLSYMGSIQNRYYSISNSDSVVTLNGTCLPLDRMTIVLQEYYSYDRIIELINSIDRKRTDLILPLVVITALLFTFILFFYNVF